MTVIEQNQRGDGLRRGPALTFLEQDPKIIDQNHHPWQTNFKKLNQSVPDFVTSSGFNRSIQEA